MTVDPNRHIIDYLNGYLQQKAPSFAVMVSGPWGSGKTYFLKKFIEERNAENEAAGGVDKEKFCFVSLNGAETVAALEKKLFFALHPSFNKKHTKLFAHFATGALSLIPGGDEAKKVISELKLSDFNSGAHERVLIFDDLERCNLNIVSSLGYINDFVEHSGCHVIVACDEKNIEDEKFKKLKEKVFGKTATIQTNFDEIIPKFIDAVETEETKDFLKKKSLLVTNIFNASESKNLRLLRYGIMDFAEVYLRIQKVIADNRKSLSATDEDINENILRQHLCFWFAIGAGEIDASYATVEINDGFLRPLTDKAPVEKSEKRKKQRRFWDKYRETFGGHASGPMLSSWSGWFEGAQFDDAAFCQNLFSGEFSEDKPIWFGLLHHVLQQDDELERAIETTWKELAAKKIKDPMDVLFIADMFLQLVDDEILLKSRADIVQEISEYMKTVPLDMALLPELNTPLLSHRGYGLNQRGTKEISALVDVLKKKILETAQNEGKRNQAEILDWVENDPDRFFIEFSPSQRSGPPNPSIFLQIPVLSGIDADAFAESFRHTKNNLKGKVILALEERAKYSPRFDAEFDFFEKLCASIEKIVDSADKIAPSILLMKNYLNENLYKAVKTFEKSDSGE